MTMQYWMHIQDLSPSVLPILAANDSGWICCALPIALAVIAGIVNAVSKGSSGATAAASKGGGGEAAAAGSNSLKLLSEDHRIGGAAVTRFFLRGKMSLPSGGVLVRSTLTIVDITDGTAVPQRVLGLDQGHAGPDGAFVEVKQTLVEAAVTDWQVFNVGFAAEPLVVCARRGRRKLRATVKLDSTFGQIGRWEHDFALEETSMGYLEAGKRKTAAKLGVARFVVAIAACDGSIDQREGDTIQRLFTDRFNLKDDEEARSEFKVAFREARQSLAARTTRPGDLLSQAATDIKDDDELRQLAFEFAVQVAAADGTIAQAEQSMLERGAQALGLADEDRRRIIERFVRVDMYASASQGSGSKGEQSEEARLRIALQVPEGLRGPELSAWLTAEYGKWNGRVGLPDAAKRDEATKRLAHIARLRSLVS